MRRNKMKKLFNWIFSKKKEEVKEEWTIQRCGWEQSANNYDAFVNYMRGQQ